jgi:Fe-S-cluster-containing hydrogenase component 2
MAVTVNEELCTGCGACVEVCPVEAISLDDGKAHVDGEKCVDCGVCVGECPTDAISLE